MLVSLYHFLGFVNGRLAGIALPTGRDASGSICWCEWSVMHSDSWRPVLTWYDISLSDQLSQLFAAWHSKTSDDFWRNVLQRAARLTSAANHPEPTDTAIVTAATGLELLAWAILRIDHQWITPDSGTIKASGMNRLLLGWAGIPLTVPPELQHLATVARSRDLDGPASIAWTRNRLVHPPRRPQDGWPPGDLLRDTWRLALEYLELSILRLLDYTGDYGHRRHLNGRWVGETTPVPWATTTDP